MKKTKVSKYIHQQGKNKMFDSIKRKLGNWLLSSSKNSIELESSAKYSISRHDIDGRIRFELTPARGGTIVSIRTYDHAKDEQHDVLHVIHENDDLSKAVADLVSLEILRM